MELPAGVNTGDRLRVNNQHIVEVHVRPKPGFQRDGVNVYSKAKIGLAQSVLGGHIYIPGLSGEIKLTVRSDGGGRKGDGKARLPRRTSGVTRPRNPTAAFADAMVWFMPPPSLARSGAGENNVWPANATAEPRLSVAAAWKPKGRPLCDL